MMNQKLMKMLPRKAQEGIVLLESLIAVLIFSLGIIALIGLQAAMLKSVSGAEYRSDAIYIAQQRLGVMWADPTNLGAYAEVNTNIALLPNGQRTVQVTPQVDPLAPPTILITITWQSPGEPMHTYSTSARVTG